MKKSPEKHPGAKISRNIDYLMIFFVALSPCRQITS